MIPADRKTVRTIAPYAVGHYAVFRHSGNTNRAHFQAIHDERDVADSEAVRLLMDTIGKMGPDLDQAFYVVEIKAVYRYKDKKFEQDMPGVADTKQKPLTDEEVTALFNKLCNERAAWPDRRYRDFARWVEAAHGIK